MTAAGEMLPWGHNIFGQPGKGVRSRRLVPVPLGPPQFEDAPLAMVACGGSHTLVVTRAERRRRPCECLPFPAGALAVRSLCRNALTRFNTAGAHRAASLLAPLFSLSAMPW